MLKARTEKELDVNQKTVNPGSDRRWSRVAASGLALALLAGLVVLSAALGYRTESLALRSSFAVLRWGAYAGGGAVLVSLLGAVLAIARRQPLRSLAIAGCGIILGGVVFALPARQQALAREVPPIHDITTDPDDPPAFVAVLPLRTDAPNSAEYDPSVAPEQRDAYPDLRPLMLDAPPATAFDRALDAVEALGWDLVAADADTGRIEATDTTFWYGFKDDVVIRIRQAGDGSRVDVRSVSRVGGSDVGANAQRIREYARRIAGT